MEQGPQMGHYCLMPIPWANTGPHPKGVYQGIYPCTYHPDGAPDGDIP